jgi:protein-S-isoprenylcysteine O-methyltransferase Ste14
VGYLGLIIQLGILLVSAGKFSWDRAWELTGLFFFFLVVYTVIMLKVDPGLLNERGVGFRKDTKSFDKVFFICWRLLTIITLVVAGFDAVRFQWSTMTSDYIILGIALLIPGCILSIWAPAVNTHFEPTVRIQKDRNHQVCTSGPYKFVRHPGYTSLILFTLGMPFILGSWWALVSSVAIVGITLFRTAKEDKTLQEELPGYREYTASTRYRLIPYLW